MNNKNILNSPIILLPCQITCGAFSGEINFQFCDYFNNIISMACPNHYVYDENLNNLKDKTLTTDIKTGYVKVSILEIKKDNDKIKVYLNIPSINYVEYVCVEYNRLVLIKNTSDDISFSDIEKINNIDTELPAIFDVKKENSILSDIHETMRGFYNGGVISKKTMEKFDKLCLSENT